MLKGTCNCKAVTFTVTKPATTSACHCGQCRKQSGHHWASGHMPVTDYDIKGEVCWYASSATAKRGFCPTCGCFLFWKNNDEDAMSFSLGIIDGPTNLTLTRHIFTGDKGDYYEIADGVPQREH
ncbi:MAG: hypothetical protein ACI9PY_001577 [Ascidiaceihabitans sp.]|jgi:hypothetical protein